MKKTGLVLCVLALLGILALPSALPAEQTTPRPFAPVRFGPVSDPAPVLPYAPDRIRVKFSEDGLRGSLLSDVEMRRGATAGRAGTGIPSVDAFVTEVGVARIERQHDMPADGAMARRLGVDRWFTLFVEPGADIPALAEWLEADPAVEFAAPDWRVYPALVPNDSGYTDNWAHDNTAQLLSYNWSTHSHEDGSSVGTVGFDCNAPAAWDILSGYGSSSVIIAIIDSGVDTDHPDINCVAGYDYGDNDSDPDDDSSGGGHGTCCAGVAAGIADNSRYAVGAAGGCSIMPMKIADSAGSMYISSMPPAIYYAVDNGADIISMSLGAALSSEPDTDTAIEYAWNHGVVVLAATGNENASSISYPANNQYAIGVGAASPCGERKRSSSNSSEVNYGVNTDPNGYTCDGERWWGSNYGSTTQDAAGAVDVIAPTILPTTDVLGSGGYTSGDYDQWFNGTSCATPYAAGVCGLIVSQNPGLTAQQIRDQLCTTAEDVISVESGSGWDRYAGYGMVDAQSALGGSIETPPTAEFSGSPTSGDAPLTVQFTDASSGSPTSWSWDFGDGVGTSTAQNPSYTYDAAGTYTVTLTATNAYGSDAVTKTDYITVTAPVPVADFAGDPTSGNAPLTVQFTDTSTNSPTSWSWDFGDGVGSSTAQNPAYTYDAAGTYTVSLTVTNAHGSDTETKLDYITVASASRSYATSDVGVTGTRTNDYTATYSSDDVRESITEVLYTNHPRKTYSYLEHRWTFNVTASDQVTFYVEAAKSSSSDGDNFVFSYTTDGANYYDLVTVSNTTEQLYSASLPSGTGGAVTIRVVDTARSWDGTDLDTISIDEMYIETTGGGDQPPVAAFAGSPTSGSAPLTVQFTDASTNNPTSWSWDFGDGVGTSTEQDPSYTYDAAGTYTVTLTATNAYGSDTETKTDYITVTAPTPVANFTADPTSGYAPLTVQFTDTSTNSPTSWSWDFGDGVGTSTAQNPSYTYDSAGTYTVSLTVTNTYGSDTETKTDHISVTEQGTNTVHVSNMSVTRKVAGPWNMGHVYVTVVNQDGTPVANATVSGYFNEPNTSTKTGTTDGSGVAFIEGDRIRSSIADFCFTVTDIAYSGYTYDPAANAVTTACESGWQSMFAADAPIGEAGLRFNRPNPFRGKTNIVFALENESHVTLEVFNVAGRRIDVLADRTMPAGLHSVDWNAGDRPSGVYFCRLTTGRTIETKAMVLIR